MVSCCHPQNPPLPKPETQVALGQTLGIRYYLGSSGGCSLAETSEGEFFGEVQELHGVVGKKLHGHFPSKGIFRVFRGISGKFSCVPKGISNTTLVSWSSSFFLSSFWCCSSISQCEESEGLIQWSIHDVFWEELLWYLCEGTYPIKCSYSNKLSPFQLVHHSPDLVNLGKIYHSPRSWCGIFEALLAAA